MKLFVRLAAAAIALVVSSVAAHASTDPRGPGRPTLPAERPDSEAGTVPESPDLSAYRLLTIRDLSAGEALRKDYQQELTAELSDRLAEAIAEASELELEVRRGEPLGQRGELVLSGVLVQAKKGNRAARYFVGPLARARIVTDMSLSDGATGEVLAEGRVKKLWAWPGWAGVTRGLHGLEKSACSEVIDFLRLSRPEGHAEQMARLHP